MWLMTCITGNFKQDLVTLVSCNFLDWGALGNTFMAIFGLVTIADKTGHPGHPHYQLLGCAIIAAGT
jgi:hypothetical protein